MSFSNFNGFIRQFYASFYYSLIEQFNKLTDITLDLSLLRYHPNIYFNEFIPERLFPLVVENNNIRTTQVLKTLATILL